MIVKLLTEHHLEFLSSKRGCRCPINCFPFRPQYYFYLMSPFSLVFSFIIAQTNVFACIFALSGVNKISIWNKQIASSIYLIKQVGKCLKSDDQIRREHRKSRF